MHMLSTRFPCWRSAAIHESSPGWDIVCRRLSAECAAYTASQYDMSVPFGSVVKGVRMPTPTHRSENLESQTFDDGIFDIVITLDVFEHIFRPDLAIKEIARTLRPGGATLMTVPIVLKAKKSRRRAIMVDEKIIHLAEPQEHGNPLGGGALVTVDWGYDILSYLSHHSGLAFQMVQIDNIDLGIRGDLSEVLIGYKLPLPIL
jgi:SAM-dependent methyltransferase